jgi:hypothetical protein
MDWVAVAVVAWVTVSALVAVVIGRAIHLADQRADVVLRHDAWAAEARTTARPEDEPAP